MQDIVIHTGIFWLLFISILMWGVIFRIFWISRETRKKIETLENILSNISEFLDKMNEKLDKLQSSIK